MTKKTYIIPLPLGEVFSALDFPATAKAKATKTGVFAGGTKVTGLSPLNKTLNAHFPHDYLKKTTNNPLIFHPILSV